MRFHLGAFFRSGWVLIWVGFDLGISPLRHPFTCLTHSSPILIVPLSPILVYPVHVLNYDRCLHSQSWIDYGETTS